MRMSELHADLNRYNDKIESRIRRDEDVRDRFAAAALTALLQRPDTKDLPCENIAKMAYIYADEMLAAREAK